MYDDDDAVVDVHSEQSYVDDPEPEPDPEDSVMYVEDPEVYPSDEHGFFDSVTGALVDGGGADPLHFLPLRQDDLMHDRVSEHLDSVLGPPIDMSSVYMVVSGIGGGGMGACFGLHFLRRSHLTVTCVVGCGLHVVLTVVVHLVGHLTFGCGGGGGGGGGGGHGFGTL